MIVFALLAGLVMFNTIRLAIYSNREEIGVMRVVGASNASCAARSSWKACSAARSPPSSRSSSPRRSLFRRRPYLNVFIPGMNIFQYFATHIVQLFLYMLLFGVALGGLSSFVSVKRYLKN